MQANGFLPRAVLPLLSVLVLAVAGCGGGKQASRGGATSSPEATQQTAAVRVEGESLPTYRGLAYDDDAVGEKAPTLVGEDFDGRPTTLESDAQGPVKLVVFLAHWMSFSDQAADTLGSWLSEASVPSNVSLYVVSSYARPSGQNYPPSEWLHGKLSAAGSRVRVLADSADSQAAKAYGTDRLPFWIFLDSDNNVLARYAGQLSGSELAGLVGSLASGAAITLPAHGWSGETPSSSPEPTETSEPAPAPTRSSDPSFQLTADYLMSKVGRQLSEADVQQLAQICYRNFYYRQDIHCEAEKGFGLSLDGDTVRELYLYDYYPPDQSSFPGALPGGVSWDSTLGSIIDSLGRPECVTSNIGYGLHYTMSGLDVEYSVTADMEPTADLQKIIVRAGADRPLDCHPYTR